MRIQETFAKLTNPDDEKIYKLAQQVLKGEQAWLESGIIGMADYDAVEKWESAAEAETVGAAR